MFWLRVEVAGLGGKLEAKLVEVQVRAKIFELQIRAKNSGSGQSKNI